MSAELLGKAVGRLGASLSTLESLCAGLDAETSRWKPAPQAWSVREVMGHLWDEEVHDFRARLRLTLEDPEQPWPPLNPPQRVLDLEFNEQALETLRERFKRERAASLEWLRSLEAPDFDKAHPHPGGFTLLAGDLLAGWVAHDLLHIRQLTRLLRQRWEQEAAPYRLEYAGPW